MDAHDLKARQVALLVLGGTLLVSAGVALALTSPKPFNMVLGFVFACIGLAMVCYRWLESLSSGLFATAFLIFAAMFNYVAFWPGKRNFVFSINDGAYQPASEWSGRIAFGIGALMLDAIVIFILVLWAVSTRRKA